MKKHHLFSFVLALLMFPVLNVSANTYQITQNAVFTSPTNCPGATVSTQTPNWTGGNFTLNMTHNIFNVPSSPNYASNVNNTGWRYIYWDVYDVDGSGNEILEHTFTEYSRILSGGVNSGSSSSSFSLNMNDIVTAGISDGEKVIRLRIGMSLTGKSHTINGEIQANGVEQCDANPLDGNFFSCEVGVIDCFTLQTCAANLNVLGYAYLSPIIDLNGNITYEVRYSYSANISGGSGNYSYYWYGPGIPQTSNGPTYNYRPNGKGWIYLTVVDNETGCIYYWTSKYGKTNDLASVQSLDFQIGPNPIQQGEKLTSRFSLNQDDSYSIQIFDINGRVFMNAQDLPAITSGEQTLELPNNLAPGIYFVRITSQELGSKTKRLVVQ